MLQRRRVVGVSVATLVAATVLWLSADAAHAGCAAGPGNGDARIRKGKGDYIGEGVYSCVREDQLVVKSLAPGRKFIAGVRVKNDGNGPTGITMRGDVLADPGAEDDFRVKFLKKNGKDVTEKVLNAELVYSNVAEDASTPRLDVVVKARDSADPGDTTYVFVRGLLGDNPLDTGDLVVALGSLPE
jgi:hypothetical protein